MDLYHNNMSSCSQKVRLVLREKNLKPVEHHLNLRAGDATRPEYLQLNPNGVVPTLVDQGAVIIESAVICEYLEEAYPQNPLRPEDPVKRAMMRQWTRLPDAWLHQAVGATSLALGFRQQLLALPAEVREKMLADKPDPRMREVMRQILDHGLDAPIAVGAVKDYDRMLGMMHRQLEQSPWLAGDEYSLADVAMLPYVCRLEHLDMTWMWEESRPTVSAWLKRTKARPNYAAIHDYLDPKYLELMSKAGQDARDRLRAILGQ